MIADGFGAHESAEIQRFAYEHNIILARLGSHTSLFYDRARQKAFTARNIRSGWKKTGLNPWNPNIVLDTIQRPQTDVLAKSPMAEKVDTCYQFQIIQHVIKTHKTSDSLISLRKDLKDHISKSIVLDIPLKLQIYKIANAAENAFADRALLLDDNQLLFKQNCEKTKRKTTRSTIVGTARVLSYNDLVKAELQYDTQKAKDQANRGRRRSNRIHETPAQVLSKRSRSKELKEATNQITELGLQEYCSVLSFN